MSQDLQGHYAGFASRTVAYLLDGAVVAISLGVMVWLVNAVKSLLALQSLIDMPVLDAPFQLVLTGVGAALIIALYRIFFWSTVGQTPGLKFMGLRVVATDGRRLSGKRALLRMVGYFISTLPFYLGFLWVLVDDRRQGWHDKLARSYVIYDWEARFGGKQLTRVLERGRQRTQDRESQTPA